MLALDLWCVFHRVLLDRLSHSLRRITTLTVSPLQPAPRHTLFIEALQLLQHPLAFSVAVMIVTNSYSANHISPHAHAGLPLILSPNLDKGRDNALNAVVSVTSILHCLRGRTPY